MYIGLKTSCFILKQPDRANLEKQDFANFLLQWYWMGCSNHSTCCHDCIAEHLHFVVPPGTKAKRGKYIMFT